jgi:steroid 5-alpha reductase family enzyme
MLATLLAIAEFIFAFMISLLDLLSVVTTLFTVIGVIFVFVTSLFVLSVIIKRNDIADIAWGFGIFLVGVTSYVVRVEPTLLTAALVGLGGLWGLRLTIRILLRNIKKSEDYRYKKWRDEWGAWFYPRSYLQVYLLQGLLMVVIGYPFIHASVFGGVLEASPLIIAGFVVWCIGYFFEVVGDYQLDQFLKNKDNHGTIMNKGLWKYSRHPNYFGEVTMWWGIFLVMLTMPFGYVAIISPLVITFLILKVSGIPMLEKSFEGKPGFAEYKRKTSVFFPLPPKE